MKAGADNENLLQRLEEVRRRKQEEETWGAACQAEK